MPAPRNALISDLKASGLISGDAAITLKADRDRTLQSLSGGGDATVRRLDGADPHALDDPFVGTALGAPTGWTVVQEAAGDPWEYGLAGQGLCLAHPGDNSADGDYSALLKALGGLAPPVTVESAFRLGLFARNYQTIGVGFSSAAAVDSGSQAFTVYTTSDSGVFVAGHHKDNFDTTNQATVGQTATLSLVGAWVYCACVWVSADTFRYLVSVDGRGWFQLGADTAKTLTPSHAGLFFTPYSDGSPVVATAAYFRVTEGAKTAGLS